MPLDGEGGRKAETEDQALLHSRFVFGTLLNEVYLLMDFVSGRAERSLAGLEGMDVPGRPADAPPATRGDVLEHICKLRYPPPAFDPISAENAAFLLLVKDRLNTLTAPANGLTIAFTTMAVGVDISRADKRNPDSQLASRFALARNAYPGLAGPAARQRRFNAIALSFVLLLTLLTAYTSGVVAFGQKTLDDIDAANAASARTIAEIRLAETSLRGEVGPGAAATETAAPFIRLCDRPTALRWRLKTASPPIVLPVHPTAKPDDTPVDVDAFDNPAEAALCDQLFSAGRQVDLVYDNLYRFEDRNLYLYEAPLIWARDVHHWLAPKPPAADAAQADGTPAAAKSGDDEHDGAQWVKLVLSSLGSYVLPMCFTLLGSALSIGRDIYGKMRASTLDPRDRPLSYVRLALGLAAGAAIGLFVSPGAAGTTAGGQAITLSTSSLAFLAGYGVDSVFALFDSLLKRVTEVAKPKASE
jgi:hypothetical protein